MTVKIFLDQSAPFCSIAGVSKAPTLHVRIDHDVRRPLEKKAEANASTANRTANHLLRKQLKLKPKAVK